MSNVIDESVFNNSQGDRMELFTWMSQHGWPGYQPYAADHAQVKK